MVADGYLTPPPPPPGWTCCGKTWTGKTWTKSNDTERVNMKTREDILGMTQMPVREVDLPAWGDDVYVRMLPALERDAFELSCQDDAMGFRNVRARLVVLAACDASGERIFQDADATALGLTPAIHLDVIFTEAQKLNGMREEDIADLAGN